MISTTHAAGNNTITLEATVSSVCEVSFDNDKGKVEWDLNPTQSNEELAALNEEVVIKFTGCTQGGDTPMYLTSNAVTENGCVEASNGSEARMQFCFKDESDDEIKVSEPNNVLQVKSRVIDASQTKSVKAFEDAFRTIKVYPQLDGDGTALVEGTYTGSVTVVSNIN